MVSKYRLYRVEKSAQGFVLLAKVCPWQENHYSVIKKTFGQQTVLPQFFCARYPYIQLAPNSKAISTN
jgi:hypothetical protein